MFQGKVQDLVRDDKRTRIEPPCHAEPWTDENQACFSIWFAYFLPSADGYFIPVHRKGFSDANLRKGGSARLCRFGIPFTIIGFKIQYLSLLKYRGTLIYPVRNNDPLGFESQRLEFLTGFTSGAISITIYVIACGARFPSEQVEPLRARAEARGSSTYFVGRKLQEEPVTG